MPLLRPCGGDSIDSKRKRIAIGDKPGCEVAAKDQKMMTQRVYGSAAAVLSNPERGPECSGLTAAADITFAICVQRLPQKTDIAYRSDLDLAHCQSLVCRLHGVAEREARHKKGLTDRIIRQ
jgi:hypothetical protein